MEGFPNIQTLLDRDRVKIACSLTLVAKNHIKIACWKRISRISELRCKIETLKMHLIEWGFLQLVYFVSDKLCWRNNLLKVDFLNFQTLLERNRVVEILSHTRVDFISQLNINFLFVFSRGLMAKRSHRLEQEVRHIINMAICTARQIQQQPMKSETTI